jgi:hypothetical protein
VLTVRVSLSVFLLVSGCRVLIVDSRCRPPSFTFSIVGVGCQLVVKSGLSGLSLFKFVENVTLSMERNIF